MSQYWLKSSKTNHKNKYRNNFKTKIYTYTDERKNVDTLISNFYWFQMDLFLTLCEYISHHQPHLITNSSANNQGTVPNDTTTSPDEIVKGSLFMPNSLLESVGDELKRCQFVMYEKTTFFDVSSSWKPFYCYSTAAQ